MRIHLKFLILLGLVLITGCSPMVKKVDYKQAPLVPEDATPTPLKFSGIKLLLPPGMELGYETYGGQFCTLPRYPVSRNILNKEIDKKFLRQAFHDAMEANGYDVTDSIDVLFAPEDEEQRAEYSIAGKIKDVHVDMCTTNPTTGLIFFTWRPGTKGEMYVSIDWSVYDLLRRHVVFKATSEGYTRRRLPNEEGITLMFQDAFEMAVHNLAANPEFFDLIVHGKKPSKDYSGFGRRKEKFNERPRLYDPLENVILEDRPLSRQPFKKTAMENRKAAVMIQKNGHGSGFFISKQGHIITNAHVVGDAHRIRVVTADKKEKLIAEVLRINKARDVALLKLEEIPENMEITILPIRTAWPDVGEDVYAIGVPIDYKALQTTVTKGIVSAHRNLKYQGLRLKYIQADVEIHGGNSGGPLLDEYGNIVGITVRGYGTDDVGVGLNLFIPIEEALQTLDITIAGKSFKPYETERIRPERNPEEEPIALIP